MIDITDDDLTRLLTEAASSYDVPSHGPEELLAALGDVPRRNPRVRRTWLLSSAAAVALAGGLFLAVDHGNPTVASQSATSQHSRQLAASDVRRDALAPGVKGAAGTSPTGATVASSGGVASSTGGGAAAGPGDLAFAPAAPGAPAEPALGGLAAPPLSALGAPVNDDGRSRVVKTGSIALVVKSNRVTPTLTAVEQAAKLDGGYLAAGTTNEYGNSPSGELTIRVPVANFEDLVAHVRGLVAKVRTATTSGRDVTAAYSDLQAQLRTLTATRDRFYVILTKASTIGEILTVQQRIDDVSGQIDRIEGERKLLASQSDLASLTVTVSEVGDPVVQATAKERSGLSRSLSDAKDGFVTGVESIISHSGRAVLWLLCIFAIALLLRGGWRVARRRMV